MVLELEVYQAIGLLITLIGSVVGVSKAFLARIEASIHERDKMLESTMNNLAKSLQAQTDEVRQIEKDLLSLKAELPEKYVYKADFNRTFTVVDAKLDKLYGIITQHNNKE